MHSNEWSETVLVCIAIFLLGAAFTWPLLLNFNSMIYGQLGDATDAITTVEILARNNFLATGNSVSEDFGAPFGSDAKYQYFIPPVLYIMLPLSTAFGAIAAHNLVKFLSLPIAAIAMYFLSKRFLKRKSSSFIAAFLFAFYPLNFHSISATFTKSNIGVIPLFVFALIKFNERKSNKNALLLGLVTFTTAFFSYYHFFFAILFTGIFFCHKILLEKKPGKKTRGTTKAQPAKALSAALPFAVAFFSFAILFIAFIAPLILSAKEAAGSAEASVFSGRREGLMRLVFSSAWPSYFVTPPAGHPVFGQFTLPLIYEHMVGIGFGPTALYLSITALVLGTYALHKKRRDKTIDML
ncbi:MAG: hypothetical protein Q8N60_01460, partial [Candidatus Diapherotrites archaeon]|nr:hypothetical protein [Candidatus Diapherotrites archaeon]